MLMEIERRLRERVDDALRFKYGVYPDPVIQQRVDDEWQAMERVHTIEDVAMLYELILWLKAQNHLYYLRGTAGSSFIFYILGMTSGNPLPPHYYCPACHAVHWCKECLDGFDLPRNVVCEDDGSVLIADGHDIPWQVLFGYDECSPAYQIELPQDLYKTVQDHIVNENGHIMECDDVNKMMTYSRIRMTFGLDKHEMCKWDDSINFTFLQAKQLFSKDITAQLVSSADSFADVISCLGLTKSTGVWDKEAAFMNSNLGYAPSELIVFRDDIFRYLIEHGFTEKEAWFGMNQVRKGKGLSEITSDMRHAKDKWVLERCEKIKYLFPKAHCIEYVLWRLKY